MDEELGEILVVEDDPEINELVGAFVESAGYRYRPALDGESALGRVREHLPALVLLDVMLPDINGFEVCKRIKGAPATQTVPIVFLTALDRAEYHDIGRRIGAADYLAKPFHPDRLLDAIRRHAVTRGNGNGKDAPAAVS
ncbi:MAG: response regulator transcription factor [Thermoanaerobaculia bacterium]